jgi:N utilization substance protein A
MDATWRQTMNSHPEDIDEVRRLFHEHVPEVASGLVEIRGLVRHPGNRSILAVSSKDPAVDPIGACVGHRGSRIKSIAARLNEYIDILGWSESPERLAVNVMHPWPVLRASFDETTRQATVILANRRIHHWSEDDELESAPAPDRLALQLSLFSQLTGWRLKVELPDDR